MKSAIAFFLWLTTNVLSGQSFSQISNLAEEYYNAGKYQEAVEFYEWIHNVRPEDNIAHLKLAISLHHSLKYEKARVHFEELIENGFQNEKVTYYYGWLLKVSGEYRKADSVFNLLIENPTTSADMKRLGGFQQQGCRLGIRMLKIKNPHDLRLMEGVNSPEHDFGLIQHKGGYVALSSTRKTKSHQLYDGQYGGLLPSIVTYQKNEDNVWKQGSTFDKLNTKWAEGTGSFSADGKSLYFSSCKGDEGCKVLVSRLDSLEKWSAPIVLNENVNKPGYDSKQPNLSVTGDTLFFVSNRPGGQGGSDIWMCFKLRENEWAPAINMGAAINTVADEMSPHYSSAFGVLLFASNGHAGYGGYDLYMAKGVSFFAPNIYNIGPPFNSTYDDTYFSLGRDKGFLSTNRNRTDFDIYEFDYSNEIALLRSFMTDASLIDLILQGSTSLDLHAFRLEEYEDYYLLQPTITSEEGISSELSFQKLIGAGTPQSIIRLNLNDTLEMLTKVAMNGGFEIRMVPDSVHRAVVSQDKKPVEYGLLAMRFEGYRYEFEKIYFDFDSKELREESRETLNDLVETFSRDNIVMIDIHTHTDHFGDHEYNYALSENRGLNILEYLNKKGIGYEQIRVFPNGEKNLLSQDDSWYSRLFNRRAEIVIYTLHPVVFSTPEVFIIRKDVSILQASVSLKIPDGKLHEWNGLGEKVSGLKEGHVLRVFDPKHLVPNHRYLIPENAVGKELIAYVVKPGDRLSDLAKRFDVIEEFLSEENHLKDGRLVPGQEIIIIKN